MNRLVKNSILLVCLSFYSALGAGADEQLDNISGSAPVVESPGSYLDPASDAKDGSDDGPVQRVSMSFEEANIKDVIKTFSIQTGLNLITSQEVEDVAITLYLEDVTVLDAFDQILKAANLTYERPGGSEIYIIKPMPPEAEKPQEPLATKVYRLKFARVSASRLAKANDALGSQTPFESQTAGTAASSGGTGAASGGSGQGSGSGSSASVTIGIDEVVREVLTPSGTLLVDGRTNSLVVTDLVSNFPRIEAVLDALDVKTSQLLIESELLETSITKLKNIGVKWGTGVNGTMVTLTPGISTTRWPYPWIPKEFGVLPTGVSGSNGNIEFEGIVTEPGQMSLGLIDTAQMQAILDALEQDTDTKVLARPKVLTLDNESAVIKLTTNQAIGFTTSESSTSGTTSVTPERQITGVILTVTPQINDDGFITMLVEPSVTKVVASQVTPPASVGGTVVDPKTRASRALVRIRNNDTLVMGGLIDRSEQEAIRKVPILSGIPFVGNAFKHSSMNDSSSELIVFITPRVLKEYAVSSITSQQAPSLLVSREQEKESSREEMMEQTLNRIQKSQF